METRVRYIVVGLFVLVVGFGALFFGLWMQGEGGIGGRRDLRIVFNGPAPGLQVGAAVAFNGLRIGEVTHLGLDPANPAVVDATASVKADAPISPATSVTLETQGLMGTVYVSLNGGSAGQSIFRNAKGVPTLQAEGSKSLTGEARDALSQVRSLVADNSAPLHDVITNIQTFSAALARNSGKVDTILAGLDKLAGGGEKAAPPLTFDIEAPNFPALLSSAPQAKLVVADPTSVVALDTQKIVLRKSDGQLLPQSAQLADSSPKLVQKKLVEAFENAGYRFAVLPGDNAAADFQLAVDLRRFWIVQGTPAKAEVELGLRLMSGDNDIIAAHVAKGEAEAGATDGPQAAEAMSKAFALATRDALTWAGSAIAKAPKPKQAKKSEPPPAPGSDSDEGPDEIAAPPPPPPGPLPAAPAAPAKGRGQQRSGGR